MYSPVVSGSVLSAKPNKKVEIMSSDHALMTAFLEDPAFGFDQDPFLKAMLPFVYDIETTLQSWARQPVHAVNIVRARWPVAASWLGAGRDLLASLEEHMPSYYRGVSKRDLIERVRAVLHSWEEQPMGVKIQELEALREAGRSEEELLAYLGANEVVQKYWPDLTLKELLPIQPGLFIPNPFTS